MLNVLSGSGITVTYPTGWYSHHIFWGHWNWCKVFKFSFLYNLFSLTKFYGQNFYIGILFKSVGPKLRGDILPHNKCFLKLNLIYSNLFKENFLLLKWTFLDIVSIPPLPLEKTCSDICFQKVFPHPLIWTFHGWSEGGPQQ